MKYSKTFKEALRQVREDGHTDVASAVRQCKTTMEDASQMLSKLQSMNPEDSLPSWWMNKIAIAADNMNKLRDYLLVPSTNEAVQPEQDKSQSELQALKDKITKLELELKIEKDKVVKPEPNPETGEVPLRTGVAAAILDKNSPKKPKLQTQSSKKLKMSLGKSKIEVNPDVAMGVYSGGSKAPDGKLY